MLYTHQNLLWYILAHAPSVNQIECKTAQYFLKNPDENTKRSTKRRGWKYSLLSEDYYFLNLFVILSPNSSWPYLQWMDIKGAIGKVPTNQWNNGIHMRLAE